MYKQSSNWSLSTVKHPRVTRSPPIGIYECTTIPFSFTDELLNDDFGGFVADPVAVSIQLKIKDFFLQFSFKAVDTIGNYSK